MLPVKALASDDDRPGVVHAAAVPAAGGIAIRDRQAVEGGCHARSDAEKTRELLVAADGQLGGAGAGDRQVVRDVQLAAGQDDGAGQPRLEDDAVGAAVGVGLGDGVAQRAGAPVVQGRDGESRQHHAALQLFQGQARRADAAAGPPPRTSGNQGGSERAGGRPASAD